MLIKLCTIILAINATLSKQESLTWREAFEKCKRDNAYLESDIDTMEFGPAKKYSMSQSSTWIGSVELRSKWLEIRGCYNITETASVNIPSVKSIANCEIECQDFKFFAYRTGKCSVCKCLSEISINSTDTRNCEKENTYQTVYRRYTDSTLYETQQENCMYMSCTPPKTINGPYVTKCKSSFAHGVCGKGEPINDWTLGWNGSLRYCVNNYGTYFLDNFLTGCRYVLTKSWTRYFRQQVSFYYDVHSPKDEIKGHQLVRCASKRWNIENNSWMKEYIDCNTTLSRYFCKKDSSYQVTDTPQSLMPTVKKQNLTIGAVVGGLTVIVGVGILILVCKIRSFGIFAKKKDHSVIECSKETCEGSDQRTPIKMQPHVKNIENRHEIQKTKDTYAEVKKPKKTENMNTLYSEVNKTRKLSPDIRETDDNYSEFTEGEYDRLNNFDRRILEKDLNMYDSNVGIRNDQDPMYDTTLGASSCERKDVYDHSSTNVNTDSNYDCSLSLAQTQIKENDIYDKSV